jgi:adenylate kinase
VQRPDDRPETIARRLAVYREETQAVRGTYERRGDVVAIDGARPIDEVAGEMDRRLDAIAR